MATSRANIRSELSLDTSKFSAALRRAPAMANRAMAQVGRAVAKVGGAMARAAMNVAKIGTAFALVATGVGLAKFIAGIKAAADAGGRLSDLAAQTGVSVKGLVLLRRAFADNGIEAEKVGSIINKMQRTIIDFGDGLSTQSRAFERLGITFAEINGLDPAAQFELIQRKISQLQNPTERAAVAMQIFGRAGGQLLTLFADGKAFDSAAVTMGRQAEILDANATRFDHISDMLANAGEKLQGFFVGSLSKIAEPIERALEAWNRADFAGAGEAFGTKIQPAVERIAELFQSFGQDGFGDLLVAELELAFLQAGEKLTDIMGKAWEKFIDFASDKFAAMITDLIPQDPEEFITGTPGDFPSTPEGNAARLRAVMGQLGDDATYTGSNGGGSSDAVIDARLRRDAILAKIKGNRATAPAADSPGGSTSAPGGAFAGGMKEIVNGNGQGFSIGKMLPYITKGAFDIVSASQRKAAEIKSVNERMRGAAESGFTGLVGFGQMQLDRLHGIDPGTNNRFTADRARLGISSGLDTGGLGAKRKVGREKSEEELKRQAEYSKSSNEHLMDIKNTIGKALTVS